MLLGLDGSIVQRSTEEESEWEVMGKNTDLVDARASFELNRHRIVSLLTDMKEDFDAK